MQVKETANKGLKREYTITVEADRLEDQMNKRLQKLGGNVKMPGFRPGKVPNAVLKQRYGKSVLSEVVDNTIKDEATKLLKEKNFRVAIPPQYELVTVGEGEPLEFKMIIELFPEVPTVDFSKIEIERLAVDVAEKDVNEGLKRLGRAFRSTKKVEEKRAAKNGDIVVIDFLGKVAGEPFDGGKAENFSLELGSGQFIPGFEPQLEGMKVGDEKVIDVTFPKEYQSKELAGKDATFDIKLHEIRAVELPEMDDAFAKEKGFGSIDELRGKVKEQIEGDFSKVARSQMKKALFDALDEEVDFELPETMLKQEFDSIWQRAQQAIKSGEMAADGTEEEMKEEYEALAKRRVKLGLFLAEISTKEKLEVTPEELRKAVIEQAQMFPGQEQKVFDYYRKNPAHTQELVGPLLEEKSVDFILGKVKSKEKKVTPEELEQMERDVEEGSAKRTAKKAAKKSSKKK